MSHNVSWSLGSSLLDILLAAFLVPEQSACTYPGSGCQGASGVTVQPASAAEADDSRSLLLRCDRHDLAELNRTLCADVLASSGAGPSGPSLLVLCQALSSLNTRQMEQVWSNMCLVVQALASPLLGGADCPPAGQDPPAGSGSSPAPHRVAREASNLQQLACDYNSWLANGAEAVLVSLCSDNKREAFVRRVCGDALLMRTLLSDENNLWLYGYCANSSADPGYLVGHLCEYQQWAVQPTEPVAPALLEFCLNLDGPRLSSLICQNTGFFLIISSNPQNGRLVPNCSALSPPAPGQSSLTLASCRYSEWRDVTHVSSDLLSQCVRFDGAGFTQEVCANQTFLSSLLLDRANAWLGDHCSTSLNTPAPEEPTQPLDIAGWCDYGTWAQRDVDDSVVGLCWQNDRAAFEKNVCCKATVFEKLLGNPQNQWLKSACSNVNEAELLAQVSSALDARKQKNRRKALTVEICSSGVQVL